jgi:hypothetical protein
MPRSRVLLAVVITLSLVSCRSLDSDEASTIFASCLDRNGVQAEDVVVTMDGDSVSEISLMILSEGDVAYEPTLRLSCTEEVENQ